MATPSILWPSSRPTGWACSGCGLVNNSAILDDTCPSCGHTRCEECELCGDSSFRGPVAGAQPTSPDPVPSNTLRPDAEPFVATQSTFLVPAAEISSEVLLSNVARYLGSDATISFGKYTDVPSNKVAVGYLVNAHRALSMQEIAYLRTNPSNSEAGKLSNYPNSGSSSSQRPPGNNFNGASSPDTSKASPTYQHQATFSNHGYIVNQPHDPSLYSFTSGSPYIRNYSTQSAHSGGSNLSNLTPQSFPSLPNMEPPQIRFSDWEAHSLRTRRIDDFVADQDSLDLHFRGPDFAERLAKISSVVNSDNLPVRKLSNCPTPRVSSTTHGIINSNEQHEGWEIVDPFNLKNKTTRGVSSDISIPNVGSEDTKVLELLDTRYSLITKPQRFFKVGRVFMTLWSEPASSTVRDGLHVSSSPIGARIYSETRRFIVVQGRLGYSLCCPIQTYRKQGTTKSRISLESHAIVYVAGSEPKLLPQEEVPGLGNFPIVLGDKSVTIDPSSRLNFGKVYTVEHNIKVRNVGKVDKESLPRLRAALLKSMGVDSPEVEMETETEDDASGPIHI